MSAPRLIWCETHCCERIELISRWAAGWPCIGLTFASNDSRGKPVDDERSWIQRMSGEKKKASRDWYQAFYERRAAQRRQEVTQEAAAVEAKTGQIPIANRSSVG